MKQPIFHREAYLRKLRPFYRSDLIKVITGIRRCGKSCLLLSVMEELRRGGVPAENIVYVNLDKRGFKNIRRPEQLEEAVASRLPAQADQVYLFVDEVQNVEDFEPVLNAFREEGVSIFVTGSNSYLLGGDLATKLTGRHVEFDLFPLSFREWLDMRAFLGKPAVADRNAAFAEYVRSGGLPKTLEFDDPEARETYVESVVEQILHKDVRRRFKIRNRPVFDKVRTYGSGRACPSRNGLFGGIWTSWRRPASCIRARGSTSNPADPSAAAESSIWPTPDSTSRRTRTTGSTTAPFSRTSFSPISGAKDSGCPSDGSATSNATSSCGAAKTTPTSRSR